MICHLMFNFWRCLRSGCLIWVLNKLSRPRSHWPPSLPLPPRLPPTLSVPPIFFCLFALISVGSITARGKKKRFPLATENEAPISVQGWAALLTFDTAPGCSLLPSHIQSGICLLPDKDRSAVSLSRVPCFYSRGPYICHTSLTWHFCSAPLSNGCVNRLTPRRWTRWTKNHRAHLPRWWTSDECLKVADGFSDAIIFHHLFLMCCVGGTHGINEYSWMRRRPICIIVISTRVVRLCKLRPHISVWPHSPLFLLN